MVQLRAAYSYATDEGIIDKSPFTRRFVMPKKSDPEHTTLTIEQLERYRRRAKGWRQKVLIALLMWTGMRRDEIRLLNWSNVDLCAGTITFLGKQDKRRTIPIHPELRKALEGAERVDEMFAGLCPSGEEPVLRPGPIKHYSPNGLRHLLDKVVDEGVSFHWFRRTVATSLARNTTADVRDRVMGWAKGNMYQRSYDGLTIDDLREGVLKLYVKEGLGTLEEMP
jgi:integrase